MKFNLPTEITIDSVEITNLEEQEYLSIMKVNLRLSPLGQFRKESRHQITMSTALHPKFKKELCKALEESMGLAIADLRKEAT